MCARAKSLHCNPVGCSPPGSSVHGIFPDKNPGVGCHALLQGVFLNQGLNLGLPRLLHWQADSLPLVPPVKPVVGIKPMRSPSNSS